MAQPPAVGPLPRLEPTRPTRFVLSNGLEVLAVRRGVAPLVAVNVIFRVGSDADGPELVGLGSSTADLLDEGAGARGPLQMAEDLEQLGADLWLGCGRDGSQLSLQVPRKGFEDVATSRMGHNASNGASATFLPETIHRTSSKLGHGPVKEIAKFSVALFKP